MAYVIARDHVAAFLQVRIIPGEKAFQQRHTPASPGQRETHNPVDISIVDKTGTFLLWYDRTNTSTVIPH
jgi:hypothetical protein